MQKPHKTRIQLNSLSLHLKGMELEISNLAQDFQTLEKKQPTFEVSNEIFRFRV